MSLDPLITRRRVLAAGAGTAGIAVLAACSSSDTSSADESTAGGAAPGSDSPSDAGSAGSSSSGESAGSSGSSSGGSADDDALATLSDVPVGGAISVKLPNGKPGIVGRPTATTAVCFSAICTHQGCTVKPAGKTLDCPCHGSKYNALTGAVLNPPAPSPLAKVDVTVKDGKVVAT